MARPRNSRDLVPRNTAARKQAEHHAQGGVLPLDVMLHSMRRSWEIAQTAASEGKEDRETEYLALAVKHASEAAPYCHAKLASVAVKGDADSPLQVIIRRLTDASNAV